VDPAGIGGGKLEMHVVRGETAFGPGPTLSKKMPKGKKVPKTLITIEWSNHRMTVIGVKLNVVNLPEATTSSHHRPPSTAASMTVGMTAADLKSGLQQPHNLAGA